jgi:mannosyltransferase OCH1-like enzyme
MAPDPNKIIHGLWIGPALSVMEQLSIASFLRQGHDYELYVYDDVGNVPSGTVVRDAAEIVPPSRIFRYRHSPSYAGFANFFRYKLLLERGGWWADTDVICLKQFDFPAEYVFASEVNHKGKEVVTNAVIKAPAGSSVMAYAWQVCQTKKPELLVWGETGPKLMQQAVKKFALELYQQRAQVFCPVDYEKWRVSLQPGFANAFDAETYAVHLWNEMWRKAGQQKDADYPATCLYEQLKQAYLAPAGFSQPGSRGLSSDINLIVAEA